MRLITLLIGLLFCIQSFSQDLIRTHYALKVGPSYANVFADNIEGEGRNGFQDTNYYFGISATTPLSWNFHLKQELLYLQVFDSSILELPLLFQYDFVPNWNAIAGFHFSYAFENITTKSNPLQDTKNFGVGIGAGIQYKFYKRFFLEARTSYVLNDQIADFDFINGKAFTLRIGLGYTL